MLRITVSEKGGSDKDFYFDTEEVTIGRVQGNSVVLAKPNVSKRHAMITLVDGAISVLDRKSTNGTYVNGRRITSARALSTDDRIYIGDYTIRARVEDVVDSVVEEPALEPVSVEMQHHATIAMPAFKGDLPPMPEPADLSGPIDDFDLDVDVVIDDESSEVAPPPIPDDAPSVETAAPLTYDLADDVDPFEVESIPEELMAIPEDPVVMTVDSAVDFGPDEPEISATGDFVSVENQSSSHLSGLSQRVASVVAPDRSSDRYQEALGWVAERAAEEIFAVVPTDKGDFADDEWQALSDGVMRLVDRLRRENVVPASVDPYRLTQDILFEFTGLGLLEEPLADNSVRVLMVDGVDRVFVTRSGGTERYPRGFANEHTQLRVVTKLLALAGLTADSIDQPIVEGRLPDGTYLQVVNPPLSTAGRVILLERPEGGSLALTDFVTADLLSAGHANLIKTAVKSARNILVTGPRGVNKYPLFNALVGEIPENDRAVVLEGRRAVGWSHSNVVLLDKGQVLRVMGSRSCLVSRLGSDRVILTDVEADSAQFLVSMALSGQTGLLLSMNAMDEAQAITRLSLMVRFANPGIDYDTSLSMVRSAVDLVVFMTFGDDGRACVKGLYEFDGGVLKPV